MNHSINNILTIPKAKDICIQDNRIARINNLINLPKDTLRNGIIRLNLNLLLLG